MNSFILALRMLRREWRSGELRILALALITAIAATTAISFFTDRLASGMSLQSSELIGGDLVLRAGRQLNPDWLSMAQEYELETAVTTEFQTVVVSDEDILLSSVKAVSNTYPLRGSVGLSDQAYGEQYFVQRAPRTGEVWVDQRVLTRLNIETGDEITIGISAFVVSSVLTLEPDNGGDLFNLNPRVIMSLDDLPGTQVLQTGSRANYQYLYAGSAVTEFRSRLEPLLGPGYRLLDVKSGGQRAAEMLNRAEQYLRLTSLLAIILAAVAIGVATQRYSERHFDVSAMLRCFGASQNKILGIYVNQLIILAVLGGIFGSLLGWLAQFGLVQILQSLMPAGLPAPGYQPLITGFITGALILTGTALPPVLRLKQVPPLRVIRRDLTPLPVSAWVAYTIAWGALGGLVVILSNDILISLALFGALAVIASILALLVYFFLQKAQRQGSAGLSFIQRGFNSLAKRASSNTGQVIAFSVTIMLMLVIALLRTQLLENWQAQVNESTPNHFAYNILADDADRFRVQLQDESLTEMLMYPMVRARILNINERDIMARTGEGQRRPGNRERNLTWSSALPADNRIIEGEWWQPGIASEPEVSLEIEFAADLGIQLGDVLTFDAAGSRFEARVTSLRSVVWESFRPNFFIMFPPGVLEQYPATYLTSFKLAPESKSLLPRLVRQFPSVTIIEVDVLIARISAIIAQVSLAVELMMVFVLLAGFSVLFAAIQSSRDGRMHEAALMRALGARLSYLRNMSITEFALLGFISGLLAILGAEIINYVLYTRVFELEYHRVWWLLLIIPVASAVVISSVGYFATRAALHKSPNFILQNY